MHQHNFDAIRPYHDSEVAAVVERLLKDPAFFNVMSYVHPDWSAQQVEATLRKVKTVADFQEHIAHPSMRVLLDHTINELTISGLEHIEKDRSYLFVSNHRDIILDSAILNVLLFEQQFGTIQTAIGNNLLSSELITDLMKLNKNFVVTRNTGARAFYENTMLLSAYIRYVICSEGQSVWIAQREGRAKDGLDKTQPGLLKMLSMSCDLPLRKCIKDLRITPVAISYEYDPCDVLKIPELKAISRDEKYHKGEEEDLTSILKGLTGFKGRVHISIGQTIDKQLEALADFPALNDKLRILGELIDNQIYQNYRLWPSNYAAAALLGHSDVKVSAEYLAAFEQRCRERLRDHNLSSEEDYRWLLTMYANPVKNRVGIGQE